MCTPMYTPVIIHYYRLIVETREVITLLYLSKVYRNKLPGSQTLSHTVLHNIRYPSPALLPKIR